MPPEDDTAIALSEDTAARYEAYGWHVQIVEGGEVAAVKKAATFPPAGPTSCLPARSVRGGTKDHIIARHR
jgi:hypothetical protein